jgi:hypothetical protein
LRSRAAGTWRRGLVISTLRLKFGMQGRNLPDNSMKACHEKVLVVSEGCVEQSVTHSPVTSTNCVNIQEILVNSSFGVIYWRVVFIGCCFGTPCSTCWVDKRLPGVLYLLADVSEHLLPPSGSIRGYLACCVYWLTFRNTLFHLLGR